MDTTVQWGQIQGRDITFPLEVRSFNAVTMGFSVPTAAAAPLLPGDAFELIEISDGVAQLIVNICDYRDNPWGDYNEINLGFLARPAGASDDVVGSFIYRMPVDQDFTCEAVATRSWASPRRSSRSMCATATPSPSSSGRAGNGRSPSKFPG